jgi:hypothetical protein
VNKLREGGILKGVNNARVMDEIDSLLTMKIIEIKVKAEAVDAS